MKKIMTFFVIGLFLCSIVLAATPRQAAINAKLDDRLELAIDKCVEEGQTKEICEKQVNRIREVTTTAANKIKAVDKARVKKLIETQKLREKKSYEQFKEKDFRARVVTKEKVEAAKKRFDELKSKYTEIKEKQKTQKENWKEAKEKLAKCKEDDTCEEQGKKIKGDAKARLDNIADNILNHLNRWVEKVENNEDLTEEEASERLEILNEKISEVNDAKEKIELLNENSSKDDYKEIAQDLNKKIKGYQEHLKKTAALVSKNSIGRFVVSADNMQIRLDKLLEKLEADGIDTSSISTEDFEKFLDAAKSDYEEATTLFDSDDIESSEEKIKSAKENLKEASDELKEIYKKLKELNVEDELEETEVDVDSEVAEADSLNDEETETTDDNSEYESDNDSADDSEDNEDSTDDSEDDDSKNNETGDLE